MSAKTEAATKLATTILNSVKVSAAVGTAGWMLAGASLLSDLYAAEVDCGSPVRESIRKVGSKTDEAENAIARFMGRMEYEIKQMYRVDP
ncbi:MAG: hypothetical protein U0996_26545 [Planctomycetaceae bacterium]